MGVQSQSRLSADASSAGTDAAASVDVVLLTADEKLLATLREASSAHHQLWHAESPDGAIELLVGGRSGILIADLALLGDDPAGLLERLRSQFPELIILATGRRDEEAAVAEAISNGCIYRFLHKPVSPGRANLFLYTATRRYGELREVEALALATTQQAANRPRIGKIGIGIGIAVAAVIAAATGAWLMTRGEPTSVAPAATRSPVDIALTRAQNAFKAGKLSGETNDDALALYRAVLTADPQNEAARAGIDRVIAALDKRTVVELRRGDVAAATAALAELQRAHPAHPHLAGLRRQLQALSTPAAAKPTPPVPQPAPAATSPAAASNKVTARTQGAAATATPAPPPRPAQTIVEAPTPQIDRARARLAASQLIAPVDDSAATYLRRARELGEDETKLQIVATDLASRILQQARDSLAAGKLEESVMDYTTAAALDAEFELGLPELDIVAQQLEKAQAAAAAAR